MSTKSPLHNAGAGTPSGRSRAPPSLDPRALSLATYGGDANADTAAVPPGTAVGVAHGSGRRSGQAHYTDGRTEVPTNSGHSLTASPSSVTAAAAAATVATRGQRVRDIVPRSPPQAQRPAASRGRDTGSASGGSSAGPKPTAPARSQSQPAHPPSARGALSGGATIRFNTGREAGLAGAAVSARGSAAARDTQASPRPVSAPLPAEATVRVPNGAEEAVSQQREIPVSQPHPEAPRTTLEAPSAQPSVGGSSETSSRGHTPRPVLSDQPFPGVIATTALDTPPNHMLAAASTGTTVTITATNREAGVGTAESASNKTASVAGGHTVGGGGGGATGQPLATTVRFASPMQATASASAAASAAAPAMLGVFGTVSHSDSDSKENVSRHRGVSVREEKRSPAEGSMTEVDATAFMTLYLDEGITGDGRVAVATGRMAGEANTDGSATTTGGGSPSSAMGGRGANHKDPASLLTAGVVLLRPDVVPEDLICAICLNIASDPTVTECGHIFCQRCISAAVRAKPECPLDRQPISVHDPRGGLRSDVRARRQIRRLPCLCPALLAVPQQQQALGVTIGIPAKAAAAAARLQRSLAAQGASATLPELAASGSASASRVGSVDGTQRSGPEPFKSLSQTQPPQAPGAGCLSSPGSPSRTTNDSTAVSGNGEAAEATAARSAPPSRPAGAPKATTEDARHIIGATVLERCRWTGSVGDAAEHLKVCAHYAIPCPYAAQGCKAVVPRGLMDLHMAESKDQHLSLVERALEAAQCQCAVLQEEVEVMRRRCSRFLPTAPSAVHSPASSHPELGSLNPPYSTTSTNTTLHITTPSSQHRPHAWQPQQPSQAGAAPGAAGVPVFATSPHSSGHRMSSPHHAQPVVSFSVPATRTTAPTSSGGSPMFAYHPFSATEGPLYSHPQQAAAPPATTQAALSASAPNLYAPAPLSGSAGGDHGHQHADSARADLSPPSTPPEPRASTGSAAHTEDATPAERGHLSTFAAVQGAAQRYSSGVTTFAPPTALTPAATTAVATIPRHVPTVMTTNSVGSHLVNTGGNFFIWVLPNFLESYKRTSYSRTFTAYGLRWCMGIDYHGSSNSGSNSGSGPSATSTSTATAAAAAAVTSPSAPASPSQAVSSTTAASGVPLHAYSGLYLFAQGHQQRVPFRLFLFNADPARDVVHTVEDWAESYRGKGWGPVRFIDRRTIAERGFICGSKRCLRVGVEILGAPY